MTDPKVSDVAVSNQGREKSWKEHMLKITWMSKTALLLSQEQTCVRRVSLAWLQMQSSLSECEFPLSFILAFLFFSLSCFLYSSWTQRNFLRWDRELSCVFESGVCLTPSASLSRTEETGHRDQTPCGTQNLAKDRGRSAPRWVSGCNSPSVCGLGWCRGRGELQVSHGKACFIVCLREWRIEERGSARDGRRWGWIGEEEVEQ